jgi:hypothetical protein
VIGVAIQPQQSQQLQPGAATPPPQTWVEVRRALPVGSHVLPARAPELTALNAENAHWHAVRFADGSSMQIFDRGWLGSTSLLPGQGQFVGDAYIIGKHYWIWQQAPNGIASWVDP